MKMQTTSSSVELGDAIEQPKAFQIAASKEAFSILSSGLYNNKIQAIIRELSCNAYDAHVAAERKEVPFELHLPTTFEPFFSVKDFGVGLSHQDILDLYTTYFGTNKSNSNAFVGALGLGSKSPFCYTEGFTVISRFEGKTRVYSAFLGSQGTPEILLQTEEDTPDAQNGLEVSFPVKQGDIREFQNNTESVLEFFNPTPTINREIHIKKTEYLQKNESWGLRSNSYLGVTGIRAIQGMVKYKVGSIDSSKMSLMQATIHNLPIDIFFPIGELSVAASRETLSNDDRTIANILKAYDKINAELIDNAKKQIAACDCSWKAMILLFTMTNTPNIAALYESAIDSGVFDGQYPNFTLTHGKVSVNELDYSEVKINVFTKSSRSRSDAKKEKVFELASEGRVSAQKDLDLNYRKKTYYDRQIEVGSDVLFVIDDTLRGGERYIHYLLQNAADNTQYLERSAYGGKIETIYHIVRTRKDVPIERVLRDAKTIIAGLGNPPYVLLSALKAKYKPLMDPVIPQGETVNRDILYFNKQNDIAKFNDGYERAGWLNAWEPIDIATKPIEGKNYYIPLKSLKPSDGSFEFAEDFNTFIEAAKTSKLFGIDDTTKIYGFNESSQLVKDPNWINVINLVLDKTTSVITREIELSLSFDVYPFKTKLLPILKTIGSNQMLPKDSPMQAFCSLVITVGKAPKGLAIVIANATRLKKFEIKHAFNFKEEWRKILKQYPLLQIIEESYLYSFAAEPVIEYIRLKDEDADRKANEEIVTLAFAIANNNAEETTVTPEEKKNIYAN
jgi:hypothetical protein